MLEYSLIAGILFGVFFGFMALGLNLIFGVMQVVNLAHGDFVVLGGYLAVVAYASAHVNPLMSLILALVLFVVVAYVLYFPLIPRLTKSKDPEMLSLILFFGLSQIIEALDVIGFGNNPRSLPLAIMGSAPLHFLGQNYQMAWVITALVSLIMIGVTYGFLYYTRIGYAARAVMGNRDEAMASGLPVAQTSAIIFAVGIGLAAMAGVMSPFMIGSIDPSTGLGLTTIAFAIVVIGSLGNPLGSVLGGLVYGISVMLMQTYFSSWSNLVPYLLLLIIVLVKPSGLLGRGVRNA
ncbi:branched-chain amino acid ABC transporter permease [Sulfobacillus sp. hq2]|uniref:branched-chain amino acid ABC transporter permease n=1 Tax=Sulfobacillus TaxID=28033 RepID=UPI000CCFF7B2|nr:branched-chain amino acid ABC transporter permease [Sulfobacillus sp. hq2]POB11303.1 branched-chain amino acid ABC transporter permease [Sulfobacillus sp. hq2]